MRASIPLFTALLMGCADAPILQPDDTGETTATSSTTSDTATPTDTGTTTDTSAKPAVCGDGVVSDEEACDDGNTIDGDACTNQCTVAICGDGILGPGETCDDGDTIDGNACTDHCTAAICGDGLVGPDETCDDANQIDDDGCSNKCALPRCGDAIVQAGEDCDDDGATIVCDVDCTAAACGDGLTNAQAGESCDDGDLKGGDRCSPSCTPTILRDLAVGGEFVCVAFETGGVRCWGQGEYGVVGTGQTDDLGNDPGELPVVDDIPLSGQAIALAAGMRHVCALLDSKSVQCWGFGVQGQLGYKAVGVGMGDFPGEMPPPVVTLPVTATATAISAGQDHTCAIIEGGTVRCWGDPTYGETGLSSVVKDVPGITGVVQLALGASFTCVRHDTGEVRCWGYNDQGQLGLGHTNTIDTVEEIPPPAVDLGGSAVDIDAGTAHVCAVLQDGSVRCWGRGANGALGTGGTANVGHTPESLPPLPVLFSDDEPVVVKQVATGNTHTCVLLATGEVRCFGQNWFGSLGYANIAIYLAPPVGAVELGASAVRISTAAASLADPRLGTTTCAQLSDDSLRCWGSNTFGQLGLGDVEAIGDDETPVNAIVQY